MPGLLTRTGACALLGALALLGQAGALAQPAPAADGGGQVTVDIVGLRSDRGKVFVALYRGDDGFPSKPKRAFAKQVVKSQARRARVVFERIPAGPFAVSMIHDENANDTLDTNFFGIPSEGWGTSRDAKASFGPPSYADAVLQLARGEHKHIVVHVQY